MKYPRESSAVRFLGVDGTAALRGGAPCLFDVVTQNDLYTFARPGCPILPGMGGARSQRDSFDPVTNFPFRSPLNRVVAGLSAIRK
jgi:hypothetical protein